MKKHMPRRTLLCVCIMMHFKVKHQTYHYKSSQCCCRWNITWKTLNKYFFIRLDIDYLSLKSLSLPVRRSRISVTFKMVPCMAAVLRASRNLCSFSYVLFVILLFYVLDVVSITVYDRHTLLNIGSFVAQCKPDFFEFLNAVLVRLRRRPLRPPLPTILLANIQSLDNKLCELRAHISYQWETRDSCIICLTETWMSAVVPDSAIELMGFSVHRSDRTKELTGKSRGGGICFFINNSWCDGRNLHSIKSFCSPDLEFHMLLCRPFWLPREFTVIIITAVYIPLQANTDQALKELYGNISEQETAYPDAAFIVTGDFNKANFRTIAPKYFQHITINTRGDRALDHCYSPFRDAYKSLPRPPFGKSDHSSVLLLPPLCRMSLIIFMLVSRLTTPPTQRALMMLLPSPCTLLSPTWKIRTPMWECCLWTIAQHSIHSACHTGCEAPDSRTKEISVQLDPGLSDRQKSGGQNGQQHFISADPQHWCSSGLRPQPTPVLPVHTWLCSHTQLQRHRQIHWRHNGDRPDHWQWWDGLQSGGEYPD